MATILNLKTNSDSRGDLTVIEKILPFEIKRVYYIYNLKDSQRRGSHRHKKTIQALICLQGECDIYCDNGIDKSTYTLTKPDQCLLLAPEDWHTMQNFKNNPILLILASDDYDPNDYITEKYE